ncbi:NAD-glutamate dehydrogenase [Chitinilyticum litopenaei]|uniref:NAD-glutamate dehydrogenase n=1 Tax=Chitinilyticum litopenaei TaxID=1121276 RepID=UPI00040057C4|nr:NAD-glutamate dehydrogenase [Chitinilyticum litopenaei]
MTSFATDLTAALAARKLDSLSACLAHYFRDLPDSDRTLRSPDEWLGQFLMHVRLAGDSGDLGAYRLNVCNPDLAEHGWQSRHTVIDLVIPDMPFLVDTISMALARQGLRVHVLLHPVMTGIRQSDGHIAGQLDGAGREAWMHFEVDRVTGPRVNALVAEIEAALQALQQAVHDWPDMQALVKEEQAWYAASRADGHAEIAAFLDWLLADHFVFLGSRDYHFSDGELLIRSEHDRGILRSDAPGTVSRVWQHLSPPLRARAFTGNILLIKSARRSIIHRPAYLDLVILRRFADDGSLTSERRFFGLYAASAYNTPARHIPVLRQKIEAVLARTAADLGGHRGKAMLNILDTYPRDELIEISEDDLARIATGILGLHERQHVRAFFRDDIYQRYTSVMVFVPRDNYNTDIRQKMVDILREDLAGEQVEFNVAMGDGPLARIQFRVHRRSGEQPAQDFAAIEARISKAAQRWQDGLLHALVASHGEEHGNQLFQRYQYAFSAGYCAEHPPELAVHDIVHADRACRLQALQLALHPAGPLDHELWRIKLYHAQAITLSACLPLLENLGLQVLDERPHAVTLADDSSAWIIDIGIRLPIGASLENPADRERILAGFAAIFARQTENDSFNRLQLLAGMNWQDVRLLRAYCRYLKQVGLNHSADLLADTLLKHAGIARQLVMLFHLRHQPDDPQDAVADLLAEEIAQACAALPSVDDERILSGLLSACEATVRSNFFQQAADGAPKHYLSFKIASARVQGMPQPTPLYEIFVYGAEFEGIHLRGGKVARGGLRWSDRREDFRTEVLGLVKAQMVKNTVIVPVGSKGGFVLKNPASDREQWLAQGKACYQDFIRGLLDLTDNLQQGQIQPPPRVRRRDADDPYLVVAADKGTASFSDLANTVSQEYGFWLDDAFASGGSVGYDHKKMGITARGAWVSVERHFREMGLDTRSEAFTVVGIGDMSGDVFGNGMLLSPCIRLLAAFDHRHIFLDPDPDPVVALAERQRLFALPRSSWEDYSPELISEGGGVYSRSLKKIRLSPQIQSVLSIAEAELEPAALIQRLLRAPVDLLYNGGIGTYVKASHQSHAEVNDRANDAVRIDGRELRCRVVAEGGNLGFTQSGRIEYALAGGRINTDAIDNSAGVDCSDHEVNIKILLGAILRNGDLTLKQRNELLASMTDTVAAQVLADNAAQTLAITLELAQGMSLLPVHQRLMQRLESQGKLSRRLEYLPSDSVLQERQASGQSLTRPELAVLLAYAKIVLNQALLASTLPDEPRQVGNLLHYFPAALVARYETDILAHPLRREIIATILTNRIVNNYGLTCVFRLTEETESPDERVIAALLQAEALLGSTGLITALEAQETPLPSDERVALLLAIRRHTERLARWLLQHPGLCADTLARWPQLQSALLESHGVSAAASAGWLVRTLLPHSLGLMELLQRLPAGIDPAQLPALLADYLALHRRLGLDWLSATIEGLPRGNRWQTLARLAARDELNRILAELTLAVGAAGAGRAEDWLAGQAEALTRIDRLFAGLQQEQADLAMITAALRELRARLLA